MITVEEYVDLLGRNRFREWFEDLDQSTKKRMEVVLSRLRFGHESNQKPIGDGVHEVRLFFGPGYRLYFGKRNQEWIVLLAGGSKARQSADIELAKRLWREYQER